MLTGFMKNISAIPFSNPDRKKKREQEKKKKLETVLMKDKVQDQQMTGELDKINSLRLNFLLSRHFAKF